MTWGDIITAFAIGFWVGWAITEYSHYKLERIYRGDE